MCVIIDRQPGVVIPTQKIESACTVNSDGWGFIFIDRGKLTVQKGFNPKGNDPDQILRILEEAKDIRVLMHLRYTTVGEKNVENSHPYSVLNSKVHGMDVEFMHNGTISGTQFRDDKNQYSDSRHFANKVITPLMERSLLAIDNEALLEDELVRTVLARYADTNSVFTLVDNYGHVVHFNKSRGKDFDGWWASNDYSFNAYHRTPYKGGTTYYGQGTKSGSSHSAATPSASALIEARANNTNSGNNTTYLEDWRNKNNASDTKPAAKETAETSKLMEEAQKLSKALSEPQDINSVSDIIAPDKRKNFCSLTGMEDLSLVRHFERDDCWELVTCYPEMACVLLMDLIYELELRQLKADAQENTSVSVH